MVKSESCEIYQHLVSASFRMPHVGEVMWSIGPQETIRFQTLDQIARPRREN